MLFAHLREISSFGYSLLFVCGARTFPSTWAGPLLNTRFLELKMWRARIGRDKRKASHVVQIERLISNAWTEFNGLHSDGRNTYRLGKSYPWRRFRSLAMARDWAIAYLNKTGVEHGGIIYDGSMHDA